MKKKLILFLTLIGILSVCFPLSSCGQNSNKIIHTIRNVGTYSGYRVDYIWVEFTDGTAVADVVALYYVDDVYIKTFATSLFDYLVYTSETHYVYLSVAYEQGLVTRDDLLAIAEAEKPYDTLYDENITGPIVH